MDNSRRTILKKAFYCCIGACCFGAAGCSEKSGGNGEQTQTRQQDTLPYKWIAAILQNIDENVSDDYARDIIKSGAAAHYEQLQMDKTLAQFKGKLEEFLEFPRREWGWIIDYDKQNGVILIDENKNFCCCPLVNKETGIKSPLLCYCSEGFSEKMFSTVVGSPVRAEIIESVLRGDKSCKYRIDLKPTG